MVKDKAEFKPVFDRMKHIYGQFHQGSLRVSSSDDANYILASAPVPQNRGNEVWFGGVQIRKNYVSCHLMPVYVYPDLLDDVSPGLRKRMQGKSCFNFAHVDEDLMTEFEQLSRRCYQRFLEGGWIS